MPEILTDLSPAALTAANKANLYRIFVNLFGKTGINLLVRSPIG